MPGAHKVLIAGASISIGVALSAGVFAEPDRSPILTRDIQTGDPEPAALEIGGLRLLPALAVAGGYDTNIYESSSLEVDSAVYELRPELLAELRGTRQLWQLGYQGRRIEFDASRDDDATDHRVYLQGTAELGLRHQLNGALQWYRGHERRGTGLSEGFNPAIDDSQVPTPDRFTDQRANLGYRFGAEGAPGALRFRFNHFEREYENNLVRTRYFDRDENRGAATFLWRVMPRTSLQIEGRIADIEYGEVQPGQAALDSVEQSLLAGAEWRLGDSTSASLLVGNTHKDFDDEAREDGDNLAWEVGAAWRPRSYSRFDISFERSPEETNGSGDFIDSRRASIGWEQQWLPRLGTRLAYQNVDQTYQRAERDKQMDGVLFRVSYQMRRWLRWHLDLDWREQDSEESTLIFDRSQYWLSAEITL